MHSPAKGVYHFSSLLRYLFEQLLQENEQGYFERHRRRWKVAEKETSSSLKEHLVTQFEAAMPWLREEGEGTRSSQPLTSSKMGLVNK